MQNVWSFHFETSPASVSPTFAATDVTCCRLSSTSLHSTMHCRAGVLPYFRNFAGLDSHAYLCKRLPQVFTGAVIVSPLLISIIWCLYNSIPPILLFTYAIAGRKYILSFMCFLAMILSTAAVIASLGFVWWISQQKGYNPQQFSGGAAQNPTYIGFIHTIQQWIKHGIKGEHSIYWRRAVVRVSPSFG